MSETIQSKVIKTENVKWKELIFIQDSSFKTWLPKGEEKLLASIIKYQFIDPFKVWFFEGTHYCLDGHHRFLDLNHAIEQGIEVPELLPATFIDCKDRVEAAELVLVYSSAYAKVTEAGLFDFVESNSLDWDASVLSLPGLENFNFLGDMEKDFSDNNRELDADEFEDLVIMKFQFPKEVYLEVKTNIFALQEQLGLAKPEDVLTHLLK